MCQANDRVRERAVLYILHSPPLSQLTRAYVTDKQIDWEPLLAASDRFQQPLRVMVAVAAEIARQPRITTQIGQLSALDDAQLRIVLDATALLKDLPAPRAPERELLAAYGELGDPDGLAILETDRGPHAWFSLPSLDGEHAIRGTFRQPPQPGDTITLRIEPANYPPTTPAHNAASTPISPHNAARLGTILLRHAIAADAPQATLEHARERIRILIR
jgi:hypothetical protein